MIVTDVIKVCKKHGQLKQEDTYRNNKGILLCRICKRGYVSNWAKENPDKKKIWEERNVKKRLAELEKGTIQKVCKRHGNLPIDRIRIDARGTLICRICAAEIGKKCRQRDPEAYKKRVREWFYSDRERIKRYRTQDIKNRQARNRKRYHRIKATDPVKFQHIKEINVKLQRKGRAELQDGYIAGLLRTVRRGSRKNLQYTYLAGWNIPKEVIEMKRAILLLKRTIKEKTNERK